MRRRVLNRRSGLGACARAAARLACAAVILGGCAAPAQAAPGDIFTLAGTGAAGFGGDGGAATSGTLRQPMAVAWLADGSALVADFGNHRIRRISPSGQITTVAGTGMDGYSGVAELLRHAGTQFDVDVIAAFRAELANPRDRVPRAAGFDGRVLSASAN